jgi:hypothetical protein
MLHSHGRSPCSGMTGTLSGPPQLWTVINGTAPQRSPVEATNVHCRHRRLTCSGLGGHEAGVGMS